MRIWRSAAPLVVLAGVALLGCGKSDSPRTNPTPNQDTTLSAANQVVLEVAGMT